MIFAAAVLGVMVGVFLGVGLKVIERFGSGPESKKDE
jgi:hypothetical protein